MIKKIRNSFVCTLLAFPYCLRLIFIAICSVLGFVGIVSRRIFWFSICYQFVSVLLVMGIFAAPFNAALYNIQNATGNPWAVIQLLIIVFLIVASIMAINVLIEFIFRIKCTKDEFKDYFSMQTHAHNYLMAVISLIAIYVAIEPTNALETNTMLFSCGLVLFICMMATDLYKALFLKNNVVKDIHTDYLKKCKTYMK